jgi:hypothetical protein
MTPQNIELSDSGGRLSVKWECHGEFHAILIECGGDPEFTQTVRHFMLPTTAQGCILSTGSGNWYVRVATLTGTDINGSVIWSGIYGPCGVNCEKPAIAVDPSSLNVIHTQSVLSGYRVHTDRYEPCYVLVQHSPDGLVASKSKWYWKKYNGRGYIEITGMEYGRQYSARIFTFDDWPSEKPETKTETRTEVSKNSSTTVKTTTTITKSVSNAVMQLSAGKLFQRITAARPMRNNDSSSGSVQKADSVLLAEINTKTNIRFGSHSEYVRYLAAQARAKGSFRG